MEREYKKFRYYLPHVPHSVRNHLVERHPVSVSGVHDIEPPRFPGETARLTIAYQGFADRVEVDEIRVIV